jgi:ubiquinone/menaquinone biosynthesis C-methylase UbiE
MTDTISKVREHYSAIGLTDRIKAALATVTPETEALTVAELAPLDQFHTRGILATAELARAARLDASTRVLDVGCGIGGPVRYLYESDLARILLGDSFHPGGTKLTERVRALLGLGAQSCILDIASGTGTGAFFLAGRFGCEVVGLDYGRQNIEQSRAAATASELDKRVSFRTSDAEELPFPDASFDAVICECAFCTFPDKTAAAREFARVLRSGGGIGLSDLTRGPALPEELSGLLAWVACITAR